MAVTGRTAEDQKAHATPDHTERRTAFFFIFFYGHDPSIDVWSVVVAQMSKSTASSKGDEGDPRNLMLKRDMCCSPFESRTDKSRTDEGKET